MVRPLGYTVQITLPEAEEKLEEVRKEIGSVKRKYSGLFTQLKKTMHTKDQKTLADCIGVVLPLLSQQAIQEQFSQAQKIEDTVWYQASQLQSEILKYLSRFKNTGITTFQEVIDSRDLY